MHIPYAGSHRDLPVPTLFFPPRRSSELEQGSPVRPAARSVGVVRLCPRLDHHIRDEAARLPVGEMLTDERQDTLLALDVVRRRGREEGCRTASIEGLRRHPLDAVEALAEDIVRSGDDVRSEEHTSELQSLMTTSYAVFCLKKKIHITAY